MSGTISSNSNSNHWKAQGSFQDCVPKEIPIGVSGPLDMVPRSWNGSNRRNVMKTKRKVMDFERQLKQLLTKESICSTRIDV